MQSNNRNGVTVHYDSLLSERWHKFVPPQSFEHLVRSMHALENAVDGVPAIPLYGKTDSSVVEEFYKLAQSKGIVYPQWQLDYELSRLKKWGLQGGRSKYDPILKDEVEMYVTNPLPCEADERDSNLFKGLNLQIRGIRDVIRYQKHFKKIEHRANGWNRFELKKDDIKAQEEALKVISSGEWKFGYGYVFSYIKKQKNRIFIPGPFSINLLQAQYHDVLLEAIQNDLRLKGSKSKYTFFGDKIGFYNLWNILDERSKFADPKLIVYVVRDFFHMDTTQGITQKSKHYIPKVASAFNIKKGTPNYKRLEEIMLFSNKMPIATPLGVIINEDKGEASGVTVTNQGESCVNYDYDKDLTAKILEECAKVNLKVQLLDSYGNGDDGMSRWLVFDPSRHQEFAEIVDKCAEIVCDKYKLIKNEKWHIGEYGVYCQYEVFNDKDGFHAYYPVSLALNAGMHPMHEIPKGEWDSDFIDWRWESILRNLYGRPDFEIAVDYVSNGLKRGLFGKTKEDFNRIFDKYEKYRAARRDTVDYNMVNEQWEENPRLSPVIIHIAKQRGIQL